MRAAAITFALALAACSEVGAFYCDTDEQCDFEDDDGTLVEGTCIVQYFSCAYPDNSCPAPMLRYIEDSDDEVADLCVGQENQ